MKTWVPIHCLWMLTSMDLPSLLPIILSKRLTSKSNVHIYIYMCVYIINHFSPVQTSYRTGVHVVSGTLKKVTFSVVVLLICTVLVFVICMVIPFVL